MITLGNLTQFAIANAYGPSVAMSAVTNAAEAVATLAAGHLAVVGDVLELTSGWARADRRIFRVKTVATNDVTLEGFNTTSTTQFPAGGGVGSVRRIAASAWTTLTQIADINRSGGELQFTPSDTLDDVDGRQIPTMRSPAAMSLSIYDDPALAWFATVNAASDARTPTALRITLAGGGKIYANAIWSIDSQPDIKKNELLKVNLQLTYVSAPTRYSS